MRVKTLGLEIDTTSPCVCKNFTTSFRLPPAFTVTRLAPFTACAPAVVIAPSAHVGTLFLETKIKLKARKHWITYGTTKTGQIIIDDGALIAIKNQNSLLPIGIISCKGNFHKGEVISICDRHQKEMAVGISNYSQVEVDLIKGQNSSDIGNILGQKDYDEVIHIDNMFIF